LNLPTVVPVIDVLGSAVVRAVAGDRANYQPWTSPLCGSCAPADVARTFVEQLSLAEIYLADLDAIAGAAPDWDLYRALVDAGARLCVDAGIRDAAAVRKMADFANDHPEIAGVVAGLETLSGWDVLSRLVDALGPERAVFGLDLAAGRPRTSAEMASGITSREVVAAALRSGARRWMVIDVARVGTALGPAEGVLAACREIKGRDRGAHVTAGGGVRSRDDLAALQSAGADAALVASALHDGRIDPRTAAAP
jgi:phosphoribosylformimino-5-aminoimidazole carboxamide ribotide isomerase